MTVRVSHGAPTGSIQNLWATNAKDVPTWRRGGAWLRRCDNRGRNKPDRKTAKDPIVADTRTKKRKRFIVAQRHLTRTGYTEKVVLAVEKPVERARDWACAFSISGADVNVQKTAYGVDGLQALTHALELARQTSRAFSPELSWHGIYDNGLPHYLPMHLGADVGRRLEAVVERTTAKLAARDQARLSSDSKRTP